MSKQACLDKIEAAFVAAEKHYGRRFLRCPVVFSEKMTTTGGTAQSKRTGVPVKITLSSKLLALNGQTFVDRTPGHEAAHIIAEQIAVGRGRPGAGHGPIWQEVMHVIGQPAERCHDMEVARVRHEVFCNCKTHKVSKIVFNRVAQGNARGYYCKLCKSNLTVKTQYKAPTAVVEPVKPVVTPQPKAPVKTQSKASKPGSKAEQVREIIRANPSMTTEQLVALVVKQVGFKRALAKVYVESNREKALAA